METRDLRLVDAWATQPLAGVPIVVLPDGATVEPDRQAALAREVGAAGVVSHEDGTVQYREAEVPASGVDGAIAGTVALLDTGRLEAGSHRVALPETAGPDALTVDLAADRTGTVEVPVGEVTEPTLALDAVGEALGIPVAALRDVGADLAPGRVDSFGGSLYVPVNFLEQLTNAAVDDATLASLCADTAVARVVAVTFDTLEAGHEVHARFFEPGVPGGERPASGAAAAGCGAYLAARAAFDGQRDSLRLESGHVLDRPATVECDLAATPRVSGTALTVLEGTVSLPPADDDDIVEV